MDLPKLASLPRGQLGMIAAVLVSGSLISLRSQMTQKKKEPVEEKSEMKGKRHQTKAMRVEGSILQILMKTIPEAVGKREIFDASCLTLSLLARTFLSLWIAKNMGESVKAFCQQKWAAVANMIYAFGQSTILAALVNALLKMFTDNLAYDVRERLTGRAHTLYMERMNYYKANHVGVDKLENADQLICEDLKKFSNVLADVYSQSLKPVVDFVVFSLMLGRMLGIEGPLGMYTWFTIAVAISARVAPPYAKLAALEQQFEGRFRARHANLVQNSEMVAFMRGERPERHLLDVAFDKIRVHNMAINKSKLISDFIQGYVNKYFASVVGFTLTARPVLTNRKGMGSWGPAQIANYYVQSRQIMENLANSVLALFELQKRIGTLKGIAARVNMLFEGLKFRAPILQDKIDPANPPTIVDQSVSLKFSHVDIYKPDGVLLLKDLNLEVSPGQRVIITGDNGCGKSSLFRVMCGLWPLVAGEMHRPDPKDVYFLSQVNFVPVGSLREVIIYPKSVEEYVASGGNDEDLHQILKWAHLTGFQCDGVHPSLDDVLEWNTALSPGQKQRMAFARLLYARPRFAVLDECTNGISPDIEADLYQRLTSLGMAIFSISHKLELKQHHDFELHFNADSKGSYEWIKLR